ncbi:amine oxidase [Aspergillus steynii IBT 23096]|uniref:Amine oxidase n=1 Tax=Aspergillus steynii IBT 23096 TaxID=1392250 RepID=A0A2I2GDQ5_9EURO|nr:amine oxidase [Aspergillus steynii IBT 23096]PLB50947.1 amine oxidase [Aspergillus steynii IBT 23096]
MHTHNLLPGLSLSLALTLPSLTLALQTTVDVAIVGGGLSGLSAAKDLSAAGKSFVVLEARDRVGGRVYNAPVQGGGFTEAGGEFIGPTQDRVLALADYLGLTPFPTYNLGNNTLYRNGSASHYDPNTPTGLPTGISNDALLQAVAVIGELDRMAGSIDVAAPWKHTNATLWDEVNLQTFADGILTLSDAKFLLELGVGAIWSTNMAEPSLLYIAAYIAAAGNETSVGTLERLIGVTGAAQDSRIRGGTQLLATRLASKLGEENILLNSAVRGIQKTDGGEYVVKSDAHSITAKHVVVAMSPPLAARITYDPLLPPGRDHLTQRMPMGALGKAVAIYESPWWRAKGLNAQVLSDSGAVRSTFDSSPPDESFGAIMGFMEADQMRRLDRLTEKEIQDEVVKDYVRYFGPEAANVSSWVIQRWDHEEFSRGGPVAYAPPGVLTRYAEDYLRKPVGGIHFAGTETAEYWTGYMDGAVRSGERVAKEILKA